MNNYKTRKLIILLISSIILIFMGCSHVDIPLETEVSMDRTTFSFDQDQHPYDLFPNYKLVPGDVLDVLFQIRSWAKYDEFKIAVDYTIEIKFLHAPELNETQRVRPDGHITLPYVGDIYVIGKTVDELTKELKAKYKDILSIPTLYVWIPDFRSSIKELKADLHTAPRGLSRLTTVRPDGYVTFPMVGDEFVAGKTIPEVNKILNKKYEAILPSLHCDLFLEKHSGSVIYVVGQVKTPGAYNIPRPITILEALSLAGGDIPGAKLSSIIVVRKHEDKMVATRVDLQKTLRRDGSFFFLQPNDIVYIPKTWITETAEVMRDLRDVFFFRGWSVTFSNDIHVID